MKTLILLLISSVFIAPCYAKTKTRAEEQLGVKLGTSFKFDPLSVNGKYQSPTEGLVVVENEKLIGDILDYRSNFNDRIKSTQRNEVRND